MPINDSGQTGPAAQRPWEFVTGAKWDDRTAAALDGIARSVQEWNAGQATAKAISHDERVVGTTTIALVGEYEVGIVADNEGNVTIGYRPAPEPSE